MKSSWYSRNNEAFEMAKDLALLEPIIMELQADYAEAVADNFILGRG